MKKILALMLAAVLALSLTACGGGTGDNASAGIPSGGSGDNTSGHTPDSGEEGGASIEGIVGTEEPEGETPDTEVFSPNFVVDGVYYSETSNIDPTTIIGITPEEYLEINPNKKEEALNNNSEITVFVFASLHSLEEGKGDINLPKSKYNQVFHTNVLPLELNVTGESEIYTSAYEINDNDKRMSQFWETYKSGKTLDDSYVLYDGSEDCIKIVSYFNMKYHDYKVLVDENKELVLKWGDENTQYVTAYEGKNVLKKIDLISISEDLKEKGLL